MKAEFKKLLELYEELEEAGETATLTLSTRGGKSTIKLQLESSPSLPTTSTASSNTLPPASGRRLKVEGLLGQKKLYIVYIKVGLSNPTLATG